MARIRQWYTDHLGCNFNMTLWRIKFFEDESEDFMQMWFSSEEEATEERKKLINDGITKSTTIDTVKVPIGHKDRITRPILAKFLNTYALLSGI
jgi:hypothetical protein